jgi:hypothetical protein
MRRREFIAGWSVAVCPFAAHAQQLSSPLIGFLGLGTPEISFQVLKDFRRGLNGAGYIEGLNDISTRNALVLTRGRT